jgi:hypothetical protein
MRRRRILFDLLREIAYWRSLRVLSQLMADSPGSFSTIPVPSLSRLAMEGYATILPVFEEFPRSAKN